MKTIKTKSIFSTHKTLVCLLLIAGTIVVYWPLKDNGFVKYDDDVYIVENPHVIGGLNLEDVKWAFTGPHSGNWHPLTSISHMLDYQLYGSNAFGHHLTNLILHAVNAILLFLILSWMTDSIWKSAFVAALFALHPLHVESVAWASERKDVLSTLFWLLTIGAYVRYVKHPQKPNYILVLMMFALGLMSKPMLVTLPFVLLLLDYWPLGRFHFAGESTVTKRQKDDGSKKRNRSLPASALIKEKIPLLILAAISSIITFVIQRSEGAVESWQVLPMESRIGNAMVSYLAYVQKMIWPAGLAVLYPHPGTSLPGGLVALAGVFLVGILLLVNRFKHRFPYLAVGWLWYVGTLVPVIGIVQVGLQGMADRYTYVPLIGIFIIIAWGATEMLAKFPSGKYLLAGSAVVIVSVCGICTWYQVAYWKDTVSLFRHAVEVTSNNVTAQINLAYNLSKEGKIDEGLEHCYEALRIKPDDVNTHNTLGILLADAGKLEEGVRECSEAMRLAPDYALVHHNLGILYGKQNKLDEALTQLLIAQRLNPNYTETYYNLGVLYNRQGKSEDALTNFLMTLRFNPYHAEAHNNLGILLAQQGKRDEAIGHYVEALRINPDYAEVHNNLGILLAETGRRQEAAAQYSAALRIKPNYTDAHNNLGNVLLDQGRINEAIAEYAEALRLDSNVAVAHYSLARALGRQGKIAEMTAQYLEALRIKPDYAEARYDLGNSLESQGKLDDAREQFLQVVRMKPGNPDPYNRLGVVLSKQGQPQEAIKQFSEALRLKPDFIEAHINLGGALALQGKTEEAISQISEVLRLNPGYAEAHNNLANLLTARGKNNEAIVHYEMALRIKPDYADAHNNLGVLLMDQRKFNEAITHFSEALRINPNHPKAQINLDKARQSARQTRSISPSSSQR
jgi:tetratricopeptide (TPR) repeat protein